MLSGHGVRRSNVRCAPKVVASRGLPVETTAIGHVTGGALNTSTTEALALNIERLDADLSKLQLIVEEKARSRRLSTIVSWFSLFTSVISAGISASVVILSTNAIESSRLRIEQLSTIEGYVEKLSAANNAHLASFALSSMIRSGLVDDEVLIETSYRLEDRFPLSIPTHFIKHYADRDPFDTPIGVISEVESEHDKLTVVGWALDDENSSDITIEVFIDGFLVNSVPDTYAERQPLEVYRKYKVAAALAFRVYVDRPSVRVMPYLLEVRLKDRKTNYMVIYRRGVCVNSPHIGPTPYRLPTTHLDDQMRPSNCPA